MRSTLAIVILSFSLLATSVSYAQSDEPPIDSTVTEPSPSESLDVQPAGIVQQSWEIGDAAIRAIPSPIGAALPGLLVVEDNSYGAQATLYLDDKLMSYSYSCETGRCTGFATDLWRLLPGDTRLAYVNSAMDALMNSYPDRHAYIVDLRASDSRGGGSLRMSWDETRGRTYASYPPF